MKWIEMNSGKVLVDDSTYYWLGGYTWSHNKNNNNKGYAVRTIVPKIYPYTVMLYMHRMIAGVPRPYKISWINGDSLDNRVDNLLITDEDGSDINWDFSTGYSHFKGVRWDKNNGMWIAELQGMLIDMFETELEAAIAYNSKIRTFFSDNKELLNEINL